MLRQRNPGPSRSPGLPPLRVRQFPPQSTEPINPLELIRHELAVLKKLTHENVVNLIEVLDYPGGDSIYMVLEWCARGVVTDISEGQVCTSYDEEQCRLYFRDLILGIEYLHSQGIVHRDIKPDNLLLTSQNVLKIVDFGVSEFFSREQENGDTVTIQAGSPAFMAPEMCVIPRIEYSGRAADIWAMGVTLYCLVLGRLPFVSVDGNLLDLYESIKNEPVAIPDGMNAELADVLRRLLDKNFRTRIRMSELREHPWVTLSGEDPLLPYEENTAEAVTDVTAQELERAIKGVRGVFDVVRAVNRMSKSVQKRNEQQSAETEDEEAQRGRTGRIESDDKSRDGVSLSLKTFHEGLKMRLATLSLLEEESPDEAGESERQENARSRSLDVYDRRRDE